MRDGGFVNERANVRAFVHAVADFQFFHFRREFGGKLVIHAVLDVEAVGADAGLPRVAEFAGQRALYGGVDVGIVENDERRVAAQFQRDFFHRGGALGHQFAADFGRAGEAELAYPFVARQHAADGAGRAGDDVEHARGNAGPLGEFGNRQCGQRRFRCGADDEGAACRQCGRGFAGNHGVGEVPRRDGGAHADGLADDADALIGTRGGDGVAVNALGFFGKPFDIGCAVGDFAARFGQRLALFGGQDARQIFLVRRHQVEPAAQDAAAFGGGACRPVFLRGGCGGNRGAGFAFAHIGYVGQVPACGGVAHGQGAAAFGTPPCAVNQAFGFKQGVVVQFHAAPPFLLRCRIREAV